MTLRIRTLARRLVVALTVRLPKRACRGMRFYGATCRMSGRGKSPMSDAQLLWWHRNAMRLIALDARWFRKPGTRREEVAK